LLTTTPTLLPSASLFPYTTLFRSIIIELLFLIRSAADGNNGRLFSGAIHRRAIANRGRVFARIAHLRLACTDGVPEIAPGFILRSEEHTSELQSPDHLVCRLLLAQ